MRSGHCDCRSVTRISRDYGPGKPPARPGPPVFSVIERILGEIAHYTTAVLFALALIATMGASWLGHPTPLPAIAAGLITTIFAWFIIMPALGAGIAGAKTPAPAKLRVATLVSHTVMGVGFYAGALLFGALGW